MNKGKKTLVTWAIVLCFLTATSSIAYAIISGVAIERLYAYYGFSFTAQELETMRIGDIVTYSLDATINIAAAICLIFYLKKFESNVALGRKLFFAGLILNVFASPLAIASILLYIAHFKYNDIEVIKEEREDENQEIVAKENEEVLKKKVARLRKLKEDGTITEEEFEKELLKLL